MEIVGRQICHRYPRHNGETAALEDVSFELSGSEFVCLVGPSGCGKTTLLKMLAGLIEPTSGRLEVDLKRDPARLDRGLVFQDHFVFPWMTVVDNVAFGLEFSGLPMVEKRRRAHDFVEQVGLEGFDDAYPHELSVGMRQRVSLARGFVASPQLLLMDEPLAALDALTKVILRDELLRLWQDSDALIVYVTHDLAEAVLLADRILVMSGSPGTLIEEVVVDSPRPRRMARDSTLDDLQEHVWKVLENDVRGPLLGRTTTGHDR